MSIFSRILLGCLAGALAASPLPAALDAWSPLPFIAADQIAGRLILTSDRQIAYSLEVVERVLRSDDGGRHWRQVEVPFLVLDLAVDPRDPDLIYAVTYDHLLRSEDGGRNWTPSWLKPESSSEAGGLLVSPHSADRVYFTTRDFLWRSDDGGRSFVKSASLPGSPAALAELAEAADGGLYLRRFNSCGSHGCGADPVLYRSADRGRTFTLLEPAGAGTGRIGRVLAHASRPETVHFLVGTHLMRSDDRGATVADLGALPAPGRLATDRLRPDVLYVLGPLQLWRSSDGGVSWLQLPLPGVELDFLEFAAGEGGRLTVYGHDYHFPAPAPPTTFSTEDGGAHWTPVAVSGPFPGGVRNLAISGPDGHLYAEKSQRLWRSRDGGESWISFAAPSLIGLAGDPWRDEVVYGWGRVAGESGILRSRDGGESFAAVLAVGASPLVHSLAIFARGGATGLVAALGNGQVARSADGGDHWTVGPAQVVGGGSVTLIHLVAGGDTVYGAAFGTSEIFASVDGGATWQRSGPGSSTTMVAGGAVLARLDRAAGALEYTTTGGAPLSRRELPFPIDGQRAELRADFQGNLYLLIGDVLLRTRDLGQTWQALTPQLPPTRAGLDRNFLLADPADGDHLYLGGLTGIYEGSFPGSGLLSLFRGRFAARVRWRKDPQAPWTSGPASSLTDQTGVFRLFTPERAEVAVQILDGRPLNGRFWVFVAAMTDVELEVEIEDRVSGEVWRHRQPPGEPKSVADLEALPVVPEKVGAVLPLAFGGLREVHQKVTLMNRFEIEVSRPIPDPVYPFGRQVFGDTAGFTFFDPGATDLVVNVIDGRSLNGKFWVFGGSLTDQEFTIEIRDTVTGKTWSRRNPPGSFAGFGDIDAF